MAFVVGGLVIICSWIVGFLMLFAGGMSDNISAGDDMAGQAFWVVSLGTILGALVIGSHWLPPVHW